MTVDKLLDRFVADLRGAVSPVSVWAHGSLALGDYQQGRSDLDLLAVVDRAPSREVVGVLHRRLDRDEPLAAKLHCSYLVRGELADVERRHLTWAHRELKERPVTPVTRRELAMGGRTLYGVSPGELMPDVTDAVLAGFVRADLAGFWRPATGHRRYWWKDIWVDLGMLTVARASVTLADGRLITKRAALDVLAEMDAPDEVCADIRQRRYGEAARLPPWWRWRRGETARLFVRAGIDRLTS